MLTKGLELSVVGIIVVFIFLSLLVLIMKISHIAVDFSNRHFPEKEPEHGKSEKKSAIDNDIAVAIATAYHKKMEDMKI